MVPSLVKKGVYYVSTLESIQSNIYHTLKGLMAKGCPPSWWVGRFNDTLRREGYKYKWIGVDSIVLHQIRYHNNQFKYTSVDVAV